MLFLFLAGTESIDLIASKEINCEAVSTLLIKLERKNINCNAKESLIRLEQNNLIKYKNTNDI